MADSVTSFYDSLADEYHLLFADWEASVRRQGEILDRLIAGQLGPPPHRVLDCSCGIGTQAIGLAGRGYQVHGTDISPAAVERAQREAARLGMLLTTGVADLRALDAVGGSFDVVLSCDNAIPHLLTDDDLRRAASGMWSKLREGGLLVVSIRGAAKSVRPPGRPADRVPGLGLGRSRADLHAPPVRGAGGGRRVADSPRGDDLPGAPALRAGRDAEGGGIPGGRLAAAGGDGLLPADPDGPEVALTPNHSYHGTPQSPRPLPTGEGERTLTRITPIMGPLHRPTMGPLIPTALNGERGAHVLLP
jgi:SAM-dependent methyltransferase